MAENTTIEWTDATWSPWEGCTRVSTAASGGGGCDNCYAEAMNRWLRKGENWGPGAPRREYSAAHWAKPLRWNEQAAKAGKRLKVFPSVCDPFDNEVCPDWRVRFFRLIEGTPHLTWLLLTKRIGNVAKMVEVGAPYYRLADNVWLGATIVNQEEADRDIPKLLAVPARVRFLSCEPLLGPLDLHRYMPADYLDELMPGPGSDDFLDWIIAGGESGPKARPSHPDWFRSLRDQCAITEVPFLFKQWGEFAPVSEELAPGSDEWSESMKRVGKKAAGRLLDGRTWDEFPASAPEGRE